MTYARRKKEAIHRQTRQRIISIYLLRLDFTILLEPEPSAVPMGGPKLPVENRRYSECATYEDLVGLILDKAGNQFCSRMPRAETILANV